MKSIYKYQLPIGGRVPIKMPKGAKILSLHTQRDAPCIWVEVDTEEPAIKIHHFRVYGTGHGLPDNPGTHIGTFLVEKDNFVFHVYEQENLND